MILIVGSNQLKQTEKFKLTCMKCGSNECEIEIDWAAYPSASWNNTKIICKVCHEDEMIVESDCL